jgi:hypothetical protein
VRTELRAEATREYVQKFVKSVGVSVVNGDISISGDRATIFVAFTTKKAEELRRNPQV